MVEGVVAGTGTPPVMLKELDGLGPPPVWLAADALARCTAALDSGLARETWKYSSLPKTLRGLLGAPNTSAPPLADVPAGVKLCRFSELDEPPPLTLRTERYPLAGITAMLVGDGWLIDVGRSPQSPLVLVAEAGISPPVLLRVAAGCRIAVRDNPNIGGVRAAVRLLLAARDSTVIWDQAELTDDAEQWLFLRAQLAANASLDLRQYATGAHLRRLDTQVELTGSGSSFRTEGANVVNAGLHLDRQLVVEHRGRNTKSRSRLHNVAAGRGRCSFNGRIHIHPGVSGADADLSNRNLALDGNAEINTKPELEIYTDDVKCSHGATVGQLDDNALFYLRSRGLPEPRARRMLCAGFLSGCIEGPLAQIVSADFLARFNP